MGGLFGAISNIRSNIPGFTDLIGGYANPNDGKHYTNEKEFNQFMCRTQTMSEVVTKSHVGDMRSIDDPSCLHIYYVNIIYLQMHQQYKILN